MNAAAFKPIKPMNPRTPDTKYTGDEPQWRVQPEAENRISALTKAFTWYNYHYGKKEVKELIIDWLIRNDRQRDAKEFGRVPENTIRNAMGWLCRMNLMGLQLNEHEQVTVNNAIKEHINSAQTVKEIVESVNEPEVAKPNIQDRLREKIIECAGELEGIYDQFIDDGAKMSTNYNPIATMRGMNVAPQMVYSIAEFWKIRLNELEEVVAGRDPQLVEGYGQFSKIQLRNMIKFAEKVINDCGAYVQIKKVERKPRAKKAVSPEKLASKFKYLKAFAELKLESESPARLIEAGEAWLYDTKKRKLIYVVADTHIGSLTIKNNMILGFDAGASVQKTLRKPADQLKTLLASGKPAARKYFKDIKATDTKFNGRGNENLIILIAGK